MRILITGVTGFVGRSLIDYWNRQSSFELFGSGRSSTKNQWLPHALHYIPLELTDELAVLQAFEKFRPNWVIHCAAMSKPNDCETQQELCFDANVNATKYVINACAAISCKLIFLSTDFVFGDGGPYTEMDACGPLNYYGQSKLLAESLIKNTSLHWAIVRTVLVYGRQLTGLNPTFLQWVKGQLEKGSAIKVFTDQFRTPTYINDLVAAIHLIVLQEAKGIYHICGSETFTPFEMATMVAAYYGYPIDLVLPVTRADFAEPARRPIRSTLTISKAKSELGFQPHSLSEVLPNILQ